ncbi:hypothetical protein AB1Y20_002964 [Prymnesium parvum]|uniref:Uncharacterized protein n=1 Tax=Prymnesium parvum TaxID=97485 RepID=A0AB34JD64_PRYPA
MTELQKLNQEAEKLQRDLAEGKKPEETLKKKVKPPLRGAQLRGMTELQKKNQKAEKMPRQVTWLQIVQMLRLEEMEVNQRQRVSVYLAMEAEPLTEAVQMGQQLRREVNLLRRLNQRREIMERTKSMLRGKLLMRELKQLQVVNQLSEMMNPTEMELRKMIPLRCILLMQWRKAMQQLVALVKVT